MTLALEILFKQRVMHSGSACLARDEEFMKSWLSLLNTRTIYTELSDREQETVRFTLRKLCAGYVGITDSPANSFVAELADTFPDAIIICSTRDADKWWTSFKAVADTVFLMRTLNVLFQPLSTLRFFGAWFDGLIARSALIYGTKEKASGPEWLAQHERYVENAVKSVRTGSKARVHYFNVKDGWEPLCKILDVPVPGVPFPHANDAEAVQDMLQGFIKEALKRWALIFGALGVAGYGCWTMLK